MKVGFILCLGKRGDKPGGILVHQAKNFRVEEIRHDLRVARVKEVDATYHTLPCLEKSVKICGNVVETLKVGANQVHLGEIESLFPFTKLY
jgi:hypothetical protein